MPTVPLAGRLVLPLVLLVLAGCADGYRNTLLVSAEPGEVVPRYRIEVPAGYDVRSVDYDAALVGLASGDAASTSTTVSGRGVITVYAVERATGAEVVLVYDDVPRQTRPTLLVRLDRTDAPVE